MKRVLVLADGAHEIGTEDADLQDELPALPRLIVSILGDRGGLAFRCRPFKPVAHRSLKRSIRSEPEARAFGYAKKALQAIEIAKEEGFDALVILIDRDGAPDRERIDALREGREQRVHSPKHPPCAMGAAVEAFDAWMIVDGKAIKHAGGDAAQSYPEAEKLGGRAKTPRHPKERAKAILGEDGLREKYAQIAAVVDLDLLAECCPQGFAPFREEIAEKLSALKE
jgi:hypothetical protein